MNIGIVGAGCSGSLVAIHLLQHPGNVSVHLVEPRRDLARGLAYSTTCPDHLLNVPAASMSAFPAHPAHFCEWLNFNGYPEVGPEFFAPRLVYGRYLESQLQVAVESKPGSFHRHVTGACDLRCEFGGGIRLLLRDGTSLVVDRAVLAVGNPPPVSAAVRGLAAANGQYFSSVWEEGALDLPATYPVLLIGSGLTAVDAVIALRSRGHRGTIYMVSRHGQVPHGHVPGQTGCVQNCIQDDVPAYLPLGAMVRTLRTAAKCAPEWRMVIDRLRPYSDQIWSRFTAAEKRRFRRHLKSYWDVHRHRMAPRIATELFRAQQQGELEIVAGRLRQAEVSGRCLVVEIALRGGGERIIPVGRIINCTAPNCDYRRVANPIVQSLFRQALASPGESGVGLRTNAHGALIDAAGRPSDRLFTVGPPRAGDLFESIAVPEIRVQAEALAAYLVTGR
jgi:uncharacterized NAD(P)/FAD-binding protein YdhS